MRIIILLLAIVLMSGCGVTRSTITTVGADGSQSTCTAITLTAGKDVSGAKMDCAAGSGWSVDNSDPNAEMMRTLSAMLPVILKAATAAP